MQCTFESFCNTSLSDKRTQEVAENLGLERVHAVAALFMMEWIRTGMVPDCCVSRATSAV